MLLFLTFGGENQFVYFTTYLFVGGMIVTLILQTDLLNRAIMVGDTLSVFPMFQCFWIGVSHTYYYIVNSKVLILFICIYLCIQSSVVGGVVFYQSYSLFTAFEWICLPIALACKYSQSKCSILIFMVVSGLCLYLVVIIVGIYLLSKHGEGEDPTHRSHIASGHFGALVPLSPPHRGSVSTHSFYLVESRESGHHYHRESIPLRERDKLSNGTISSRQV
jgi:hypothetical protein